MTIGRPMKTISAFILVTLIALAGLAAYAYRRHKLRSSMVDA